MSLVTLLTDFGMQDYYIGALKGTLLRLAPGCQPIDISHEIAPGDLAAGSFVLTHAAATFPAGTVHLAVVDPGVGSSRRILVVRTGGSHFVGPDNGLLTRQVATGEVYCVEETQHFLTAPGQTFHGRDRFAPLAAYLLRGGAASELGPRIDDPVRLETEPPSREGPLLRGAVIHIDRYGNLVTNVPGSWLLDPPYRAQVGPHEARLQVTHYSQLPEGEPGLLIGSVGTVELSLNGASLAAAWKASRGDAVSLESHRQ